MRAVRCHRFAALDKSGKPISKPTPIRDVLSLEKIPSPTITATDADKNKVLISTHYAGIQYPDFLQAQGLYQIRPKLPYTPGMDVAGIVVDKGSAVCHVKIGDKVYANTALCADGAGGTGALAELVSLSSHAVFPVPNGLHLSSVANIGRNYCAAYHSLKVIGNAGPSDLVLITGSSGGVGMAAIELAKAMGAKVIAGVSCIETKGSLPLVAGADKVLSYGKDRKGYKQFKLDVKAACAELGHPQGASVIVDMVHGDLFQDALVSCVKPLGKICLVGFVAGQRPIKPGLLLIMWTMNWRRSYAFYSKEGEDRKMSFLPRKEKISKKDKREKKKQRSTLGDLDNHAEKENYSYGKTEFDNVYFLLQRHSTRHVAILPYCSSKTQASFNCYKIGLHYGSSLDSLSHRLSVLGLHMISVTPGMFTVLVESGFGIVLEGIVKAIASSCNLSLVDINNSTEWVYDLPAFVDSIKNELRQFNSSGTFFGVRREAMVPFKRFTWSEGTTLAQSEEAQLLRLVPNDIIGPLQAAAQEWSSRGMNAVYPPIQSSVSPQQVDALFDGKLEDAVRPILQELGESMNNSSAVVFLLRPAEGTAASISHILNSSSTNAFYFISRTVANNNPHDRYFSCDIEIGYLTTSHAINRFRGSYQASNPSKITVLLILFSSENDAVNFESLVKRSLVKQRRRGEEFSILRSQVAGIIKSCVDTARHRATSFLGSESSIISETTIEQHIPSYTDQMSSLLDLDAAKRACIQLPLCFPRTLGTHSLSFQEAAGAIVRNEWGNVLHGVIVYCTEDTSRDSFKQICYDSQLGFNHTRSWQWLLKEVRKLLLLVERDNNSNVWGAMCLSPNPARYLFDQLGFHGRPLPQSVNESLAMKWELHVSNEFEYDCILGRDLGLDKITTLR